MRIGVGKMAKLLSPLQKTAVKIQSPTAAQPEPLVTLVAENLLLASGFCICGYMHRHTLWHMYTHNIKKENKR